MSILGAMAIAGGIGAAGTGFIFNYVKQDYQIAISNLEQLIGELEGHLQTLKTLRDNVPSFWDDDEGNDTYESLIRTIAVVQLKMDHAKSLLRVYQEAVTSFDISKTTVSSLLEDALGVLDGLAK